MYVCICKAVSDSHVVDAWQAGHRDLEAISENTGLGSCCGSCRNHARDIIEELSAAEPEMYAP